MIRSYFGSVGGRFARVWYLLREESPVLRCAGTSHFLQCALAQAWEECCSSLFDEAELACTVMCLNLFRIVIASLQALESSHATLRVTLPLTLSCTVLESARLQFVLNCSILPGCCIGPCGIRLRACFLQQLHLCS